MDATTASYYWWKTNKNQAHNDVFPYLRQLDNSQGYKQQDNLRNMRLYGNMEFSGISAFNYARTEPTYNVQNRVTLNVVQSMIDTVVSKITKNKPRPYFLTNNGDWSLQRKAEKLTQFSEGQFYGTDFYAKASVAFKDACIFGTGCLKIFRGGTDNAEIKVERVFIDEIMVDDKEAYYGEPRQLHQRKWVHKDVLKAAFPGFASQIDVSIEQIGSQKQTSERAGDMILVVESWHLKSGPKAKDGRRTICIDNATLLDEAYDKDYFPFVFFRWNLKPIGFFGQGISEQLTGLQLEINKILRTIQISMHLVSVPKMLVEASSKIVTSHLNNKIGGIIKYAGTKPEWNNNMGAIPAELFTHLNTLYSRAYEIVGISQLSAQSQKPMGLNSGKAMRTFNDLETERFMETGLRYEKTFLDAIKIMLDLAKDIAEETGNYEVKCPGSGFLKTIKWDDVQLDEDQYILQAYPTSALSQNPASRLQEVQELLQAGFVSKEDGMRLLDFPDLKRYYNMTNSGLEDINRQIELIMEEGEYQSPEPYQNLQLGLQKFQQAYLMYRTQNAPEERLDLIRRWMEDAKALLDQAQMEAQAMQAQAQMPGPTAPAGGEPIGQGAAPPVSDLMPFE